MLPPAGIRRPRGRGPGRGHIAARWTLHPCSLKSTASALPASPVPPNLACRAWGELQRLQLQAEAVEVWKNAYMACVNAEERSTILQCQGGQVPAARLRAVGPLGMPPEPLPEPRPAQSRATCTAYVVCSRSGVTCARKSSCVYAISYLGISVASCRNVSRCVPLVFKPRAHP